MKKALIIFLGLILSLAQILKTSNFLKSSEGYSLQRVISQQGRFQSGRTCFRYKYISLSENSRMNRRKDLYLFPSQKWLSLVRNLNVLIVLGTFLSLCFRLHVLEQFLSREVLVECHASLIYSTEPKYTIDTIKTGLHQLMFCLLALIEKKSILKNRKKKLCANQHPLEGSRRSKVYFWKTRVIDV